MKQILDKKVDPVHALMTRRVKVKGDMARITRIPRVAIDLVKCVTRFETVLPD